MTKVMESGKNVDLELESLQLDNKTMQQYPEEDQEEFLDFTATINKNFASIQKNFKKIQNNFKQMLPEHEESEEEEDMAITLLKALL